MVFTREVVVYSNKNHQANPGMNSQMWLPLKTGSMRIVFLLICHIFQVYNKPVLHLE